MHVGLIQVMQSWGYDGMSDAEVYQQELDSALAADEQGYDSVWVVEHHFEDYSFCPDNFVYLAHLAGRTKTFAWPQEPVLFLGTLNLCELQKRPRCSTNSPEADSY